MPLNTSDHKLIAGVLVLFGAAFIDCALLFMVHVIDWKLLPGPEAGIVSSIMTAVGSGASGRAASVIGYYFSSTPKE